MPTTPNITQRAGLAKESPRKENVDFKIGAWFLQLYIGLLFIFKRATGIEPATFGLGSVILHFNWVKPPREISRKPSPHQALFATCQLRVLCQAVPKRDLMRNRGRQGLDKENTVPVAAGRCGIPQFIFLTHFMISTCRGHFAAKISSLPLFKNYVFSRPRNDLAIWRLMPTRHANPLLFWIAKVTDRHVAHALEFLKAENEFLRSNYPKQFVATPAQRQRLVKLGKPLGTSLRSLLTIVTYTTFLRWQRESEKKPAKCAVKKPGRPKTSETTSEIILRFAKENGWGLTRILGELKKLGIRTGRTTIRNILRENGFDPAPKRGPDSWAEFLKRHAQTLWACDFLSKRIWTRSGFVDCFVFFYIHVSTRRVHLAGVTVNPNRAWLAQQARNATMLFDAQPAKPAQLIHDRDGKFNPHFESILHSSGIETIVLPPNSPNLNAFAERWVQSFRRECLDHFVVFGEEHMRLIATQYVDWYNTFRPHQSLNNAPLSNSTAPPQFNPPKTDEIRCQSWLGGLLNHYHRAAA